MVKWENYIRRKDLSLFEDNRIYFSNGIEADIISQSLDFMGLIGMELNVYYNYYKDSLKNRKEFLCKVLEVIEKLIKNKRFVEIEYNFQYIIEKGYEAVDFRRYDLKINLKLI